MRYKTVWLRPLLSALAALLLLMLLFQHFGGLTDFFNNFFDKDPDGEAETPVYWLRLVHNSGGEDATSENIELEEAVIGFVAAEMPAGYDEQALAAQAVAARSYAWQKYQAEGEVCDNSAHCMAYLDEAARRERFGSAFDEYETKLRAAAENTAGLILVQDGQPVPAYFHACCGGQTESAAACWGGASYYPAAVCYWDNLAGGGSAINSSFWPKEQLAERLQVTPAQLALLYIAGTTPSGRVKEVRCASQSWSGNDFRQLLGLASNRFSWLESKEGFWFTTLGSGHGVGLCQQGAGGLAAQGYDWPQILAVYYAGCDVCSLNELYEPTPLPDNAE